MEAGGDVRVPQVRGGVPITHPADQGGACDVPHSQGARKAGEALHEEGEEMKDHKQVEISVPDIDGHTVAHVIQVLEELSADIVNPRISLDLGSWYANEALLITGWRPLTEKEKETAKKRAAAARAAAKLRKEKQREKDLKDLERLAAKLGVEVKK